MTRVFSRSGYSLSPLSEAERNTAAQRLSPEQRRILLASGTERPFCGGLLDQHGRGVFCCGLCGLPLFSFEAKFESGTGWPSFMQPLDSEHVRCLSDNSHGMQRVEVRCARCDGHLGHVFPDGPPPRCERYCINSAALTFFAEGEMPPQYEAQE